MSHPHHFELDAAKKIGDDLGVDWTTIEVAQFRKGLEVEFEHGTRDPQTNVTGDDPLLTGKIAWAHLKEIPDYYDRLEQMEAEGEAYWEAAQSG
jgi:hypothetical protein